MNPAHQPSIKRRAASLLLLGFLACGDLKPNTGREAGLDGADAGTGSHLPGARSEGAARDADAGSADAPPSEGADLPGCDLPGCDLPNPGGPRANSGAAQPGSAGAASDGPDAGNGSAGSVGSSDAALAFTVHGRLVNAWNVPLAGVALVLGDQQLATNDAGEFIASNVQAPYDVAFVVEETAAGGNPLIADGWSFQGLTRSDPTFRVSRAGTTWSGNATFSASGISASGTGSPALSILLGVGLPNGRSGGDDLLPPNGAMVLLSWSGDSQTTGVAHGLAFTTDPLRALPSAYQGYSSLAITADGTKTYGNPYSLDLTPPITPIATRELSGTVSGGSENRINQVWLSFPDHAALLLAEENPASSTFSYLVPYLEEGTITVVASSGSTVTGSLALAHRNYDPSSAPDSELQISLPEPPTLIEPWSAATLAPDTVFGWQSENAVSVLTLLQDSPTGPHRIHVVTAEKTALIPELLSRSLLQAGDAYWRVETHSLATDLDAVTSAAGFLDPFAESSAAWGVDGFYASPSAQLIVVPASP